MGFIQTAFLAAGAAIAIPVVVHLLSRWQVRRLELGTMRFLREVVQDGAQRRKIQRWFLLFIRMAVVALLAILFARPFLPERAHRDGDRLRIIMIDRSASMGMPGQNGRLVDDAVAAAVESLSDLGSDAKVLWAWFDHQVTAMPAGTTRPSAPPGLVGDTNYTAAISWARDRVNAHPQALADVVLISDLQQSGLAADSLASEALAFPRDVPVRLIDVGRPAANNLAITHIVAPSTRLQTHRDVVISATLFNYGQLPFEDVPLTASAHDGSRTVRLKKSVNIAGEQAQEVSLDFGTMEPGTWRITLALDVDDDLAVDNRRRTALDVAESIQVLVLDSGSRDDGPAAESFFLVSALDQPGTLGDAGQLQQPPASSSLADTATSAGARTSPGRFRANVVYMQDESLELLNAGEDPLVVVADGASVSVATIERLEAYVRGGGKLLVFAGDADGEAASVGWQQSQLAPGQLQMPQQSGVMPFRIVSLNGDRPMLQPFRDPQHGDLSRLAFNTLLPVVVNPTTEVLAWFDGDQPALTQHSLGTGRVVWFLSSADSTWGDWTTSPLYLPLVQQMAADLLNLTGEGPIRLRTVGQRATPDFIPVPPVNRVKYRASESASPEQAMDLHFSELGFQQRDDALYVVNSAAKESDPSRMKPAAFAEHFKLTLADGTNATISTRVESVQQHELWPWLAAALFVLVVAEFSLANRTAAG